MRFKLDENLPPDAADLLREAGHDVRTVHDQGLRGCDDPAVLAACQVMTGRCSRSISTFRMSWRYRRNVLRASSSFASTDRGGPP